MPTSNCRIPYYYTLTLVNIPHVPYSCDEGHERKGVLLVFGLISALQHIFITWSTLPILDSIMVMQKNNFIVMDCRIGGFITSHPTRFISAWWNDIFTI